MQPPLFSLPLEAEPPAASGLAAGEREPTSILGDLGEETLETLAAWSPFPACLLGATASGRPPEVTTWLKAACSAEALHFLFFSAEPLHGGEGVAILIDPVGDLESYFEIGLSSAGFLQCAVLRRSRSGHKRDARWECQGAHGELRADEKGAWSATLSIPYLSIADHAPHPGESWLVNAQRWHIVSGGSSIRSTLERLPRFRRAVFPEWRDPQDLH